jgi:single-stranded-DNA-specific exonuclease
MNDAVSARRFLDPLLQELEDPFNITHMREAVTRLRKAMCDGERIAVFGDYDVDGVTSTVLLLDLLNRFGMSARYIVPRRSDEGYGLSHTALERMLEQGRPTLLMAVDCGTNSCAEVRWLRETGTDVIILDHHTSRDESTAAEDSILINPHLFDAESRAWRNLCTVGLVFKFAHALLKDMRADGDETAARIDLREYLDLVAMGTVADLVPLTGENRILARKGLERLASPRRTGLEALYAVSGIEKGQQLTPFDIAFRLSPRINASGRLADAGTAVEMLMGDDWARCTEAAQSLDRMNGERQQIERAIAEEAMKMVDELYPDDPALVVHAPHWHPGVVGIVASRLAGHYHRPAIVLGTEEGGGGLLKGSGRSVEGLDLVDAMTPCASLLERWGGHPMAVGITMKAENIDEFRTAFRESVAARTGKVPAQPILNIACWVETREITSKLFEEIDRLGPFGQGNPQPIIAVRAANVCGTATPFGSGHCRFQIETTPGNRIPCVAWRAGERIPPSGIPLDLAARLTWNVWKGRRTAQLQVEDWRLHEPDAAIESPDSPSLTVLEAGRKLR